MGDIRERLMTNIERVIETSGISKKEISEQLGVSPAAISNWIKGRNSPDLETLIKFCDMFHLTLNDIYSADPIKSGPDIAKKQLMANYNSLNLTGRMKLLDLSDDLVASGKYQRYKPKE